MIVFGGILDVTKELDDMTIYDIEQKRWTQLFEGLNANTQKHHDVSAPQHDGPGPDGRFNSTQQSINTSALSQTAKSPIRTGKTTEFDTPIGGSPKNATVSRITTTTKKSAKSSRRSSPNKKGLTVHTGQNTQGTTGHVTLESPTSISMKNSLIIQTSDCNFEHLYKQMVKRKVAMALSSSMTGKIHPMLGGGLSEVTSPRGDLLFVKGKRPAARDGHSAVLHEGNLIIFGGDRHHMPYNDLFIFDVATEFAIRQNVFIPAK